MFNSYSQSLLRSARCAHLPQLRCYSFYYYLVFIHYCIILNIIINLIFSVFTLLLIHHILHIQFMFNVCSFCIHRACFGRLAALTSLSCAAILFNKQSLWLCTISASPMINSYSHSRA